MSDPTITKEMRLVLSELAANGGATPADLGFNSIAFPRKARAEITDDGRRLAGRHS